MASNAMRQRGGGELRIHSRAGAQIEGLDLDMLIYARMDGEVAVARFEWRRGSRAGDID